MVQERNTNRNNTAITYQVRQQVRRITKVAKVAKLFRSPVIIGNEKVYCAGADDVVYKAANDGVAILLWFH